MRRMWRRSVLHSSDTIFVFDKAGSVRRYPAGFTIEGNSNLVTKPIVAIRDTNSYIAVTSSSLYKVTVGSSSPTIQMYYSWPSTDGTPVGLTYVNADWSALLLTQPGTNMRIFKIPNKYISQPTIYTIDMSSQFPGTLWYGLKICGFAGNYVICIGRTISSMEGFGYVIYDVLTGNLVKSRTNIDLETIITSESNYYPVVDEIHGIFMIYTEHYCYVFTSTSTAYNKYSLYPYLSDDKFTVFTLSPMTTGAAIFRCIDIVNGTCYFVGALGTGAGGENEWYVCRYQYVGSFQVSIFKIPSNVDRTSLVSLNGYNSHYISFKVGTETSYNSYARTYIMAPADMTSGWTYFEKYPSYVAIPRSFSMASTTLEILIPRPYLIIFNRFIYAYGQQTEIGMAKYDMLARDFIGIPV